MVYEKGNETSDSRRFCQAVLSQPGSKSGYAHGVSVGLFDHRAACIGAPRPYPDAPWGYIAAICVVLWATVLFGNFAESLAEGRGKAQADALRSAKRDVEACLIDNAALADAATMEDRRRFLLIEAARWDRLR